VTTRQTRSLARHHSNERAQGSRARNDPRENQQTGDRRPTGRDKQAGRPTDSCGPRPPRSASLTPITERTFSQQSPLFATSRLPRRQSNSIRQYRAIGGGVSIAQFTLPPLQGFGGAEKFRLIDIERPRGAHPTRSPGATIPTVGGGVPSECFALQSSHHVGRAVITCIAVSLCSGHIGGQRCPLSAASSVAQSIVADSASSKDRLPATSFPAEPQAPYWEFTSACGLANVCRENL
jgi:hypothetical protein